MESTDHVENWIRGYLQPRYPELVPMYREADALKRIATGSGVLSQSALDTLVTYAQDSRASLSQNVAGMLGELASKFPEAAQAVRLLATHRKLHVRLNALVSLHSLQPSPLRVELLAAMLEDRSTRLRQLAADKIMSFGERDLLPRLERAVAAETDAPTACSMNWALELLRDGYRTELQENGQIDVTVRVRAGCVSQVFSETEVRSRGLPAIVESLRHGVAGA